MRRARADANAARAHRRIAFDVGSTIHQRASDGNTRRQRADIRRAFNRNAQRVADQPTDRRTNA